MMISRARECKREKNYFRQNKTTPLPRRIVISVAVAS